MKFCKHFSLIIVSLFVSCSSPQANQEDKGLPVISLPEPVVEYGFVVDTFTLVKNEINPGESLGKILNTNGVSFSQIAIIAKETRNTDFDVRYLKAGQTYGAFKIPQQIIQLSYLYMSKTR